MKYSQKYALVSFIEPVEVGTEFTMASWPLHMTLADIFAIEMNSEIKQKLSELLLNQPDITLSTGDDATLGTTDVSLINTTDELQSFHSSIVNLLELHGVKFNNPEFTKTGFIPHVTIQKSGKLTKGDKITINTISLIDMFPNGDWQQRKVLNSFKLAKE